MSAFRNVTVTAAAAIGLLGASGMNAPATAVPQTVSYTNFISSTEVDWTGSALFNKFDTGLGTLTSVVLELTGTVTGTIQLENKGGSEQTITGNLKASQTFGFLPFATLTVIPTKTQTFAAPAYDGTTDFTGTSGITYAEQTATDSDSIELNTASLAFLGLLDDFTCSLGGCALQLSIPASASGTSNASGGGNTASSFQTFAGSDFKVTYKYDDGIVLTPEPASMALLGAGLLGMGVLRRRSSLKK